MAESQNAAMTDHPFQPEDADVLQLIDSHPLAWIVAKSAPEFAALMPILIETDAEGKPAALVGHLPRAHPIVAALAKAPRALFLFQGPHAYISPDWLSDKNWAPTWNFTVVQITADVTFDAALTDDALSRLVAHMEKDRAEPWTAAALGPRYATLRDRVIGFRGAIKQVTPRFKLGQDEKPNTFQEILRGLGDHPVAQWMRRFAGKKPAK